MKLVNWCPGTSCDPDLSKAVVVSADYTSCLVGPLQAVVVSVDYTSCRVADQSAQLA